MTAKPASMTVPVDALRPGMYVQLDLGWMNHPFPRSRFRIDDAEQIATLKRLGIQDVQVRPDLSDPAAFLEPSPQQAEPAATGEAARAPAAPESGARIEATEASRPARTPSPPPPTRDARNAATLQRRARLAAQRESLLRSERLHQQASRSWIGVMRDAVAEPQAACQGARLLASGLVDEMLGDDETTIRVLSEAAGTSASQHALNVTVLALMLGRAVGLDEPALQSLALGALLHDMGKSILPDHLRHADATNGALVLRERREHVAHGVRMGIAMGLEPVALRVIAQHHELQDGSGVPQGLAGEAIALPARIVALADVYDRLCNPRPGEPVRTPHEAQARLFASMRQQLDPVVLGAFIKMLGVYPPGSVVQLNDERLALVVSVHPDRPLKPNVVVHDPSVPREEALILNLEEQPDLGIRRSLHPQHLPRSVLDYLSPRERVSYYFARPADAPAARHVQAA